MAGLLGDDNMGGFDPMAMQNMMQSFRAMQANPFMRQIPGEQYLQGLGQLPVIPQMQPDIEGFGPMPQEMGAQPMAGANFSDFGGTTPGIPNLPDSFEGFGYGQFAPKRISPQQGLRAKLIDELMNQIGNQQMGF